MASGGIAQCEFLESFTMYMNKVDWQSLNMNGEEA